MIRQQRLWEGPRCASRLTRAEQGTNSKTHGMLGIKKAPDLPRAGSSLHTSQLFNCCRTSTRSLNFTRGQTSSCSLVTWYSDKVPNRHRRTVSARKHGSAAMCPVRSEGRTERAPQIPPPGLRGLDCVSRTLIRRMRRATGDIRLRVFLSQSACRAHGSDGPREASISAATCVRTTRSCRGNCLPCETSGADEPSGNDDDRHTIEGKVAWNFVVASSQKRNHFRENGTRETAGQRITAHDLLTKVFAKRLSEFAVSCLVMSTGEWNEKSDMGTAQPHSFMCATKTHA